MKEDILKYELAIHYAAAFAQSFGILNERAYRDLCIRLDFEKMRTQGKKVEDIMYELAEKYSIKESKISEKAILKIVYGKK